MEKGTTEDEMVGWHHQLNGHEFEQAPGIGDGQGGLACCIPWGCKEADRLSDGTELKHPFLQGIFPTQGATQVSLIAGRFFTS